MRKIIVPALFLYALAIAPAINDVSKYGALLVFSGVYGLFVYCIIFIQSEKQKKLTLKTKGK
jgi:hypothetical protein